MKTKIKFLLAGILAVSVMSSCSTCQKGIYENERSQYEKTECGMDDDAMLNDEQLVLDKEEAHASPAAERRTTTTVFDEVVEDKSVTKQTNDEQLIKQEKRSVPQLGSNKKMRVKDVLKAVREAKKKSKREDAVMLVLLVILALILPPLAVGIYEGITGRFWLVLILWLVGWGVGWWLLGPGLAGLCSLVAVILALLIVLGVW